MTDREAFEAFVTGNGRWPAAAEMGNGKYKLYSTSQAFLAWQAATAAALERAAEVCESLFDADDDSCNEAEKCAEAIRALKDDDE